MHIHMLSRRPSFGGDGWASRLESIAAPIKLGGSELLPVLTNFMSAVTISSGTRLKSPASAVHADVGGHVYSYAPRRCGAQGCEGRLGGTNDAGHPASVSPRYSFSGPYIMRSAYGSHAASGRQPGAVAHPVRGSVRGCMPRSHLLSSPSGVYEGIHALFSLLHLSYGHRRWYWLLLLGPLHWVHCMHRCPRPALLVKT